MSGRRKIFERDRLLPVPGVRHRKSVDSGIETPPEEIPPPITVVRFPREGHAGSSRSFDFQCWYGMGIDEIAYACQRQVERFVANVDVQRTPETVACYCRNGLRFFLDFCALTASALGRSLTLEDVRRDLIDGFLAHLKQTNLKATTQKKKFDSVKSVLTPLGKRGIISKATHFEPLFPRNPFPNSNRLSKGETPFSRQERKGLASALKTAVMPLLHDACEVTGELLSYAVLAIALRTGRNTTALLEMGTDCLRAHPKPGMKLLVVYKRRGNNTHKVPLREVKDLELTASALPDVVRLIDRVTILTAGLRDEAPADLRNRLWLFRSQRPGPRHGAITALGSGVLGSAAKKLVREADLKDAEGRPIRLNVSRLRKSFINRIFEILDGDILSTAKAAGNSPKVTDSHYLAPSESAQRDWRFMGQVLARELLGGKLVAEATPAGHCSDTKNGQYAPKTGVTCTNFVSCLRCRNYVVTADDLFRVFSFYWLIVRERERIPRRKWEKHYAQIVRMIDRDVAQNGVRLKTFTLARVEVERERARVSPHPFWAVPDILEAMQ